MHELKPSLQAPSLKIKLAIRISNVGIRAAIGYIVALFIAGSFDAYCQLHAAQADILIAVMKVVMMAVVIIPPFVWVYALSIASDFEAKTQLTFKDFLQFIGAKSRPDSAATNNLPIVLHKDPSGYSRHLSHPFHGVWNKYKFTGSIVDLKDKAVKGNRAANDYKQYDYEYAAITLTTNLSFPYLLLNPIIDKNMGEKGVCGQVDGTTMLSVEGNFNKRYEVSALADDHIAVLSLLTPDFMVELLDANTDAAIEFAGNHVSVIQSGIFLPNTQQIPLTQLQKTVDAVLKHIADVSDSWLSSSSTAEIAAMNDRTASLR
jgi:hypothetical protein